MSASPLSRTCFLCDQALGPWAQFSGVFAISHFGRKRRCSCETSDSRNREIGIFHFRVSGYGCTCRREPRTPDSRSSKVVDVRSTTLCSSQSDGPDNFATLCFMSHKDSTFFLSRLTKSQKVDPMIQLFPLIDDCDLFMISRFGSLRCDQLSTSSIREITTMLIVHHVSSLMDGPDLFVTSTIGDKPLPHFKTLDSHFCETSDDCHLSPQYLRPRLILCLTFDLGPLPWH
jgi:hypothetical protein